MEAALVRVDKYIIDRKAGDADFFLRFHSTKQ